MSHEPKLTPFSECDPKVGSRWLQSAINNALWMCTGEKDDTYFEIKEIDPDATPYQDEQDIRTITQVIPLLPLPPEPQYKPLMIEVYI